MRSRRPRRAAARRAFLKASGKPFFKSVLRFQVALGMKRPRHQLAPVVPMEQVIDRAIAGLVADRLLIGSLQIVDVQHFAGPGRSGKTRQERLFLGQAHILALASAVRLGLECLDATVVIGHVRAVHRAQRHTHALRNRGLRHSAFAPQHHLDALALRRRYLPAQGRLQPPHLGFGAFDHLPPRIRWRQRITAGKKKTLHQPHSPG